MAATITAADARRIADARRRRGLTVPDALDKAGTQPRVPGQRRPPQPRTARPAKAAAATREPADAATRKPADAAAAPSKTPARRQPRPAPNRRRRTRLPARGRARRGSARNLLLHPATLGTPAGGGLILALFLYPLALASLKYGAAGIPMWLEAKFLNKTPTPPEPAPPGAGSQPSHLPGGAPRTQAATRPGKSLPRTPGMRP